MKKEYAQFAIGHFGKATLNKLAKKGIEVVCLSFGSYIIHDNGTERNWTRTQIQAAA